MGRSLASVVGPLVVISTALTYGTRGWIALAVLFFATGAAFPPLVRWHLRTGSYANRPAPAHARPAHPPPGLPPAAIVAAAMANLSAAFNSLASSSVVDFYKPFFRPGASDQHYLRVSRFATLAWGAALILIAFVAQYTRESVLELALTIASVAYGSMLGIFLLGVLTKSANWRGTLTGAILGLATLITVVICGRMGLVTIAWTWYVAIGTTVTFAGGWLASQLMREAPAN